MAKRRFSPSLFDLPQDIVRGLPFDVVGEWAHSDQTPATAKRILNKTKIRGISVSSDSAGLTRLSQQKGLIEILALINRPKELIHGYGTALRGRAVGVWAADNTQMFYPEDTDRAKLVAMLLAVQDRIKQESQVQVGIGAHFGEFYNLGGGLYGPEADHIEEIAENETEGGEIVISPTISGGFGKHHEFDLHHRSDIESHFGKIYRVADGPRWHPEGELNERYPVPYSKDFYDDLLRYAHGEHTSPESLESKYSSDKVVVLIERTRPQESNAEIELLDDVASSILMRKMSRDLLTKEGQEVKIAGPLGIWVFNDVEHALAFAKAFRTELRTQDINCRIGIDRGPVLLFDLENGGKDIAGSPVNVASKMAQDKGTLGHIYVCANAISSRPDGFSDLSFTVSGVTINAYEG